MRNFIAALLKFVLLSVAVVLAAVIAMAVFPVAAPFISVGLVAVAGAEAYHLSSKAVNGIRERFGRSSERGMERGMSEHLSKGRSEGKDESRSKALAEAPAEAEGLTAAVEAVPERDDRSFFRRVFDRIDGAVGRLGERRDSLYSDRHGFRFGDPRFPSDMVPSWDSDIPSLCSFDVDGLKGRVTGVGKRNGEYHFDYRPLGEAELAKAREAAPGLGLVEAEGPGGPVFRSTDPKAVRDLAVAANPRQDVKVMREYRHTDMFVIPGCESYEEAVEKYSRMKDSLEPFHSFDEVTDTVNGVAGETRRTEAPLTASDIGPLPVGSYIVSDTSVTVRSGEFQLRHEFDPYEDFDYGKAVLERDLCVESYLSNATPKDALRYILLDNGEKFFLRRAGDVGADGVGLGAFVVCDSVEQVQDVLAGRCPEGGLPVSVGRVEPVAGPGGYVVRIPVDAQVLSRLELGGEASPALASKCESMGLSAEDVKYSRLVHELGNGRSVVAKAMLSPGMDLDRVQVNGVSASVPILDVEMAKQWREDVAQIESVSMKVDVKNAELRMTSRVYDAGSKTVLQRTEAMKLTEKEMQDYFKRGKPTQAEMKDLLMRANPEFFKTYSVEGRPVFTDPVKDFIAGRKVGVMEARRRETEKVTVEVKTEKTKAAMEKKSVKKAESKTRKVEKAQKSGLKR